VDWLAGAKSAQTKGVTQATHTKYARSWNIWLDFQRHIKLSDPYLDDQDKTTKLDIICAFMQAVRLGTFNPKSVRVSGATSRKAVSHVAATIVASGRVDPTKNSTGKTDIRIIRQAKTYREEDPPVKHQKALPPAVFRHVLSIADTTREKATADLLSGALFYGCRSCEYSLVPKKERKTRPLRVKDIEFRNGATVIPHDDPNIFHAETVVAKFGPQKGGVYEDEIPMDNTNDPILNPNIIWGRIITRIRSYPGFSPNWPVYTFYDPSTARFNPIKNTDIQRAIKSSVSALGRDTLGFGPDDVGTHSVRSSLAMQLYLQKVPNTTIMLIGRWRSDAFLSYIEKQCREFTRGMSELMLSLNSFYHLPTEPQNTKSSRNDDATPRRHTHHTSDRRAAHFIHFGRLNALRSRSLA
jgi:hypothetical protein